MTAPAFLLMLFMISHNEIVGAKVIEVEGSAAACRAAVESGAPALDEAVKKNPLPQGVDAAALACVIVRTGTST